MKIGIDARMYGSGFGLARYIQQLVLQLIKIDRKNDYVLFLRKDNFNELSRQQPAGNFKLVLADIPWYSWKEQIKFSKIIKKEKIDLMHFPHWNVPFLYNNPYIVTIHDLIMFHFPRPEATTLGPIKFWFKDMAHRLIIRNAANKAKHILVTSEFTKQDVHKTLPVPSSKMTVTYQAPFIANPKSEIRNSDLLLEKYNITKPYVLYVGAAYPHKNLNGLIKAWKIFENKYGSDFQLVLVGKESPFYNQLKNSQEVKELKNKPIFTGFVEDDKLRSLYSRAKLYVFPSLYEGFGLPPLEAMAHGVPVASSNRTSLPEVLGEAALYFDPENYEQIADILYTGLTDENIRYELKQYAANELRRYSWENLAKQTIAVYRGAGLEHESA